MGYIVTPDGKRKCNYTQRWGTLFILDDRALHLCHKSMELYFKEHID